MENQKSKTEILKEHFAKAIRAARKAAGLTQKQLAEIINVEHSLIAKYEAQKAMPSAIKIYEICEALEIPVTELFNI